MTEQQIIPTGGRIHVKLIKQSEVRKSEGGIFLPDIAENTQDCECTVLAVSNGPGYELPQWVAVRIANHYQDFYNYPGRTKEQDESDAVAVVQELCAQPREPRVEVGKRYLFDITLATQVPGTEDEFYVEENSIYAQVSENTPPLELLTIQTDFAGHRTK